ncbi:histidine kinase [Chroococcidiopsis sp. CCALA 051]|nr:histidine kinase [Chroococcidiopsis sp. CCALA 051]
MSSQPTKTQNQQAKIQNRKMPLQFVFLVPFVVQVVVAVGLTSYLSFCSERQTALLNQVVLGTTLFLGLVTAQWFAKPLFQLINASLATANGGAEQRIGKDIPVNELEEMTQQLHESLEKFTKVFRASPDPILISTWAEGRFIEVNDSFLSLFGYTREEVIGFTSVDLGLGINLEERAQVIQRLQAEGVIRNLEFDCCSKAGEIKTFLLSAEMIEIDGQACILFVSKDITERKQAELTLKDSEAKLSSILSSAGAVIARFRLFTNQDWTYEYFSAGTEAIFGYSPKELKANKTLWISRIHPEDVKTVIPQIFESVFAERQTKVEFRFQHRDGIWRWISDIIVPYRDEFADCWVVTCVEVDITERKIANEALQKLNANLEFQVAERTAQLQQALEFEAMLKRITDKVRDSLDESQILQTAVQELAVVLGATCCNTALYDLESGTSTIYYEYATINPGAQARRIQIAAFPEVYQQLLQGQSCQFCSISPNPVRGRVVMLACPIKDDQGVLGDLWLINQPDIAFNEPEIRLVQQVATQCAIALRQARLYQAAMAQVKELEKLHRLKDDFLDTVSHELRSPLSNIKVALSLLEVTLKQAGFYDAEPNRVERYLQILRNECQREISLINDLLDLSRLDAENDPLSLTTLDLSTWISPIVESFTERVRTQQQILSINIPTDLPVLTTESALLERVVTELLHNACKYTPASQQILMTADAFSNRLRLIVSNSGVEISESELDRIFDKFYRIPNSDPWKHGGTGLGLALVKKLVEHLGGTIKATASNGWTTFTVELPIRPTQC